MMPEIWVGRRTGSGSNVPLFAFAVESVAFTVPFEFGKCQTAAYVLFHVEDGCDWSASTAASS